MWKPIIIPAALVAALGCTLSVKLAEFVMNGKRQTLEEAYKWQSDHYDTSFYERAEKTEYTVEGYEGYLLHAVFMKCPQPSQKYMILTHGYSDNRFGMLKYARIYMDLGYNCVIYDIRGHGVNEATFTTYGIRESEDLRCMIADTRKRYPDISQLGLHGESLGAATTATVMKFKPEVDFAVCDCGFADIDNVIRGGAKAGHMPGFFADLADFGSRIRYHYSLKKMRPIDSLDDNEIPMLFIHGAADTFILPSNSKRMAERTKGYSEFYTIPGAGHAKSVLTDYDQYAAYVTEFLKKI